MRPTTINAVFDESGKQTDSEYVVFAGFFTTSERWDEFSRNWTASLRRKGLTFWRTSDAAHLKGEFKKFRGRRKELDDFTRSLAEIACEYAWGATASSISMEQYKALSAEARNRFKDPLYCAFESGIKTLIGAADVTPSDRFNLLCDDSEEYSSDFLKMYRRLKRLEPALTTKIGAICFVNDKTYPPVQAADLIAFCRRKELCGCAEGIWSDVMKLFLGKFSISDSVATMADGIRCVG